MKRNPIPKLVRDFAVKHHINVRYEEQPDGKLYTILDRDGKAIRYFSTASGTIAYMRRMVIARVRKPNTITRKTRKRNGRVLIYEKITRVEGTKGRGSQYAGQKFFHNFKRPYPKMYGLPDGSLLIK